MKVTRESLFFSPFSLSIKVESEAEVKAVYAMFNNADMHAAVYKAFKVTLPGLENVITPPPGNPCTVLSEALKEIV